MEIERRIQHKTNSVILGASSGEDGGFSVVSSLDGDCLDCEDARVTLASGEAPDAGTPVRPGQKVLSIYMILLLHQAFLLHVLSITPPAIHPLKHQNLLS